MSALDNSHEYGFKKENDGNILIADDKTEGQARIRNQTKTVGPGHLL